MIVLFPLPSPGVRYRYLAKKSKNSEAQPTLILGGFLNTGTNVTRGGGSNHRPCERIGSDQQFSLIRENIRPDGPPTNLSRPIESEDGPLCRRCSAFSHLTTCSNEKEVKESMPLSVTGPSRASFFLQSSTGGGSRRRDFIISF